MSTNHEHKPFTIAAEWIFFALFSSTNLNSKYPLHAAAAAAAVGGCDDCTDTAVADTVAAAATPHRRLLELEADSLGKTFK